MLRDSQPTYQLPQPSDLTLTEHHEVDHILLFIDNHISQFPLYYRQNNDSVKENWISNLLVRHFNLCNYENGGYLPYEFSKNPPQIKSTKETDIGVYINTRSSKPFPIIEFEAKRLSESCNNQEYVYGERGGIERFKKGHHSAYLKVCGMFAYIQSRTIEEWFSKVNDWLIYMAHNDTNDDLIDWLDSEQLSKVAFFPNVEKCSSCHRRKVLNNNIFLWHYFIDLTS